MRSLSFARAGKTKLASGDVDSILASLSQLAMDVPHLVAGPGALEQREEERVRRTQRGKPYGERESPRERSKDERCRSGSEAAARL